jgi:hypothetical protein
MEVKQIREDTKLRARTGPKRKDVRGIIQNAVFFYCDTTDMLRRPRLVHGSRLTCAVYWEEAQIK